MRFVVLQQVGGDMYGVYDVSMGEMVRVFDGKNAKRKAGELQSILEAGWQQNATVEATARMSFLRDKLRTDAE